LVLGRRYGEFWQDWENAFFLYIIITISESRSERRKCSLAMNESSNGCDYSASLWRADDEEEWRKISCQKRQIHNVIPDKS